jgi:hypothetical protein
MTAAVTRLRNTSTYNTLADTKQHTANHLGLSVSFSEFAIQIFLYPRSGSCFERYFTASTHKVCSLANYVRTAMSHGSYEAPLRYRDQESDACFRYGEYLVYLHPGHSPMDHPVAVDADMETYMRADADAVSKEAHCVRM